VKQINQYQIIQKINAFNENITLWYCENVEGLNLEVLTIRRDESYERLLKRLIPNEILPLSGRDITGIQKILDVGFDDENECHFIAYESLDDYDLLSDSRDNENITSVKDIAKDLDILKKENRQTYIISPHNICVNDNGNAKLKFAGLFELFKKQDLLHTEYLAPNVREWLTDCKQSRPNFQDDIYALIKSFEDFFRKRSDDASIQILENSLNEERTERFPKYHHLIERLELIPINKTAFRKRNQETIWVKTQPKHRDDFQTILDSMNENTWMLVENELSENKEQITGRFSTNDWHGRFFVDRQEYIFIPFKGCKNEKNNYIIRNSDSFLANFNFDVNPSSPYFNCVQYFKEKFDQQNTLARLNKEKKDAVYLWKTLPDKEREYIEERAFKAKYTKRKESSGNTSNIKFDLSEVKREGWARLKTLKSEEVVLFVDDRAIGRILDFHPKNNFIVIRDAFCTIDEIPEKGELIEDVRQATSQYKKQVEACYKFGSGDIVNPTLRSIMATPDATPTPQNTALLEDDYTNFKDEVYNEYLQNDEAQREAVLESLHQKPIYLIQGPPGTGKTTVIVEIIQQVLKRHNEAKILITSQSNLAVDNVLEKLNQINNEGGNLRFMRLASEFALGRDNISKDIIPHTYKHKLESWITQTQKRSEQFLRKEFKDKSKQKHLIEFYDFYSNLNKKNGWSKFNDKLKFEINYLKSLFQPTKNLKDVKQIFETELGVDFMELRKLQKDWSAFLNGAVIDDGRDRKKSMLNNGSTEIDFLTAMLRNINIIGATCIHIASSQYNRINFQFDYVIMDESSKASPAETLVPINMGRNIILIGDHKQLPPVVTREQAVKKKIEEELEDNGLDFDKDFGESLFEKLIQAFEHDPTKSAYYKMLDIQYRMPKQIGELISTHFYDKKLKNPGIEVIPDYDQQKNHGLSLKQDTSIIFVSTSNEKNPNDNDDKFLRQNKCNLAKIRDILTELNEQFTDNLQKEKPFNVGIIAGYRGQVELLKSNLNLSQYSNFVQEIKGEGRTKRTHLIEINTVDKFQGAERDIIIYDIVRSSKGQSVIGFLDDYRRINVAFSRVKRLLIIVGDSEYVLKRAILHPQSKFKEFKLQQIVNELKNQNLIVNNLKEMLS